MRMEARRLSRQLAGRIGGAARRMPTVAPQGPDYEFQKLYFDTVSATNAAAMVATLKLVPASHVMFGTDFPWGNAESGLRGLDVSIQPGGAYASVEQQVASGGRRGYVSNRNVRKHHRQSGFGSVDGPIYRSPLAAAAFRTAAKPFQSSRS